MSVYVIYYDGGAKKMRPVLNEAQYRALRDDAKNREIVNLVRGGDKEQKRKLVQMNYSCIPKADGSLKGCKTPSTTVGMDIDFNVDDPDYDQKMASVPELVLGKKDELGLLMLERSVSKGYHIVFKRHEEMSQEQNLQWASELLGVQYDIGAKDITRVFFTTTASQDDLLYLDPEIFVQKVVKTPSASLKEGGQESKKKKKSEKKELQSCSVATENTPLPTASQAEETYHGNSLSEIIAKYWELFNGGNLPAEGDRNVKTYELAMNLRAICNYDQQKLEAVIPRYDDFPEEEWRKTIANAVNEPRKGMPYRINQVLKALQSDKRITFTGGTKSTPPPMPKDLPPLIKLLTSKVPDYYKPAVASAVFPALAIHLHGVQFRYWNNEFRLPTFMHVLIARQSSGKRCIQQPIDYVLEDIKEHDKPSRMREDEYKRKNPSGKSKAKDPRPQDICIQCLVDNQTDASFNQRVVDADRNGQRFVYTQVDEIEALKKITTKGTVDEVSLLIRKAFDNSEHGQDRVGADSVSGIAPLRWNFNASTTPPNARKFFTKAVNDGTVGRLDIATIVMNDDDPPPVFGIYDDKFKEALKPYLERLTSASGLIECPEAEKLAVEIRDKNKERFELIKSEAFKTLSFRANLISWLKGMVLYVAHGYKWSKQIADFVRWSNAYNMWYKMVFFGDQLDQEMKEEDKILKNPGPQSLLDMLPNNFTDDEYLQLRFSLGKSEDGGSTLRSWISRGHIVYDDTTRMYVKTEKYLARKGLFNE